MNTPRPTDTPQPADTTSLSVFHHKYFYNTDVFVSYGIDTSNMEVGITRTIGDYIIFCLCHSGKGVLQVNDYKRTLTPDSQLVIIPNISITLLKATDDFDCSFISVSPQLRQKGHFVYNIQLIDALIFFKEQNVMHLSPAERDFFIKMRDLFVIVIQTSPEQYKIPLLSELVQTYFTWQQSIALAAINATPVNKNPSDIMAARFLGLVNEHFRTQHRLAFYASQMFISTKYLSSIVMNVTGRSASQWIAVFLVTEAQRLLAGTAMRVAEISDALGFPNQSFFGKFFKRHTGKGPLAYRLEKE